MERWRNYFSRLSELRGLAERISGLWDKLQNRMDRLELRELSSLDALMKMTVGGLRGESFGEDVLGLFYRDLYGVSFDLGEVVGRARMIEREGDEIPEEALRVEVKVDKSDFIKLVKNMESSLAEAILGA